MEFLNPLHYISAVQYSDAWVWIYGTFMQGWFARIAAGVLLLFSFWLFQRRRVLLALVLFGIVSIIVYAAGIAVFWRLT